MAVQFARALLVVLAALFVLPAISSAGENSIIIRRDDGLTVSERLDVRADADVRFERTLPISGVEVVRAPAGQRAAALDDLRQDPRVIWAEVDGTVRAATADYFPRMWALKNTGQTIGPYPGTAGVDIRAVDAWELSRGNGVTVAVTDSGVQADNPDLDGMLVAGYDFVDKDSIPQDGAGHGTHVSGTIAARDDGAGTIGVAPDSKVMPLRVLGNDNKGLWSDTVAAFAYAGTHGARVVNASLGGFGFSQAVYDVIAANPQTLYVVAAGNDTTNVDSRPYMLCSMTLPNVLCVGATSNTDTVASFSNYGRISVDLFAPGLYIYSTYPNVVGYSYLSGTSMATPHVAGVAALLLARDPSLSTAELKRLLIDGGKPLSALSDISASGNRLDAKGSLDLMHLPDTTAPDVPTGLTAVGTQAQVQLNWDPVSGDDLAGYRIYDATNPSAQPLGTSEVANFIADGLTVRANYGYQVSAIDQAGNESALSDPVFAMAGPEPEPPVVVEPPAGSDPVDDPGHGPVDPDPELAAPSDPTPIPDTPLVVPPAPMPPPAILPVIPFTPSILSIPSSAAVPGPPPMLLPPTPTRRPVKVTGLKVTGKLAAGRPIAVRYSASGAATVKLRVSQRVCKHSRCRMVVRTERNLRVARGTHTIKLTNSQINVKFRAGRWQLELSAPGNTKQIRFAVASR